MRDGAQRIVVVLLSVMATLVSALPVFAQGKPRIVTGKAAAMLFSYEGRPLHPFCLDFPLERSSRGTPSDLAKCTDRNVIPKSEGGGWWSADYPGKEGDFFISQPPGVSYGVLAKKGDRFLVATESSGGGSGQFTALFWVRLGDKQIVMVKDELGGDRCAGGLGGYRADGDAIRFTQSTPTANIVAITGLKLDNAIADKLRALYRDCDGEAHYRYDLSSEKLELTSLTLNVPDAQADAARTDDPQACFDGLVVQYAKAKKTALKPSELAEFGRSFAAACATSKIPSR